MGKFCIEPTNEIQTREWFLAHLSEFEYDILESKTSFPDYLLVKRGERMRAEIEYSSYNFLSHGHAPDGCDLVICWVHDADIPVEVLELSAKTVHAKNCGAQVDSSRKPSVAKSREFSVDKLKEILRKCEKEYEDFTDALLKDVEIYSAFEKEIIEPRLELFRVQQQLEEAMRCHGGEEALHQLGRMHPYDFASWIFRAGLCLRNMENVTNGSTG